MELREFRGEAKGVGPRVRLSLHMLLLVRAAAQGVGASHGGESDDDEKAVGGGSGGDAGSPDAIADGGAPGGDHSCHAAGSRGLDGLLGWHPSGGTGYGDASLGANDSRFLAELAAPAVAEAGGARLHLDGR